MGSKGLTTNNMQVPTNREAKRCGGGRDQPQGRVGPFIYKTKENRSSQICIDSVVTGHVRRGHHLDLAMDLSVSRHQDKHSGGKELTDSPPNAPSLMLNVGLCVVLLRADLVECVRRLRLYVAGFDCP
jgi:hypothetical protein